MIPIGCHSARVADFGFIAKTPLDIRKNEILTILENNMSSRA